MALKGLIELLYPRLQGQAARLMRGERADHTLQPTALVNEAFLRLDNADAFRSFADTPRLDAMMCKAMQEVLIDHARKRLALKRGGDWVREPLDDVCDSFVSEYGCDVIDLYEKLEALKREYPKVHQVADLKFFGFMTDEEAAEEIGISVSTVQERWRFARAWLFRQLSAKYTARGPI